MPSMAHAYEGLREAAVASARVRRPFIVHHAAASADVVVEVANDRMIAGHCNHPSFTEEESVRYARALRAKGALLEISGLDLFTRTKGKQDITNFLSLVRERLVDVVGTDYAAGNYDPVSVPLAGIVREGLCRCRGPWRFRPQRRGGCRASEAGNPGPADLAVSTQARSRTPSTSTAGRRGA
jgi:hypothetical protein